MIFLNEVKLIVSYAMETVTIKEFVVVGAGNYFVLNAILESMGYVIYALL
jgi:hypothetical protein